VVELGKKACGVVSGPPTREKRKNPAPSKGGLRDRGQKKPPLKETNRGNRCRNGPKEKGGFKVFEEKEADAGQRPGDE